MFEDEVYNIEAFTLQDSIMTIMWNIVKHLCTDSNHPSEKVFANMPTSIPISIQFVIMPFHNIVLIEEASGYETLKNIVKHNLNLCSVLFYMAQQQR